MRQAKARKCRPASTWGSRSRAGWRVAEAGGPGEAAFDAPALGQEHAATLGPAQLEHDELDAVSGHCGCRVVPEVAGGDVGDLDVLTGYRPHRPRRYLGLLAHASRSDGQRQSAPGGRSAYRQRHAPSSCCGVWPCGRPPALGGGWRPLRVRSSRRRALNNAQIVAPLPGFRRHHDQVGAMAVPSSSETALGEALRPGRSGDISARLPRRKATPRPSSNS